LKVAEDRILRLLEKDLNMRFLRNCFPKQPLFLPGGSYFPS
jgi:hypothetical protein